MGQIPQGQCQPDCGFSSEKDDDLGPDYPESWSCVRRSSNKDIDWSWEEDLETACQCGIDEDAEEYANEPIYPELGSYIVRKTSKSKAPVPRQRPKALRQHLDALTKLSNELAVGESKGEKVLDEYKDRIVDIDTGVIEEDGEYAENDQLLNFAQNNFLTWQPGSRAYMYIPAISDEIDVEVKRNLDKLEPLASRELRLRRKSVGVYEIDSRLVNVYWRGVNGTFDKDPQQLYVHEHVKETSDKDDMPLSLYLAQVSNVLLSTQKGTETGPIVSDLTFAEDGMDLRQLFQDSKTPVDFSTDREKAMQMACTQAELRQARNQDVALTAALGGRFGLNGMTLAM